MEETDREEVYDNLMYWICSLLPNNVLPTPEEVSTGKPLAEALTKLDSDRFNEDWFNKTCASVDESDNWRVKGITLKKIHKSIVTYFTEATGHSVPDELQPDVQTAARNNNKAELSKMLQIMIGVAVNCPNRTSVISNISLLEESVQRCVMMTIEQLEGERLVHPQPGGGDANAPMDPHLEHQLKKALAELQTVKESNDDLLSRCYELDSQVTQLQEEKRQLLADKVQLETRQKAFDSDSELTIGSGKKLQAMQKRLDEMQEELFRLESSREEHRLKVESLQKENKELLSKIGNVSSEEQEFQKMKDEVDELRIKVAESKKMESNLEMYKRKLDELGHLRSELKILEDKNKEYMKSAIDLEEEQRKNGALKVQLEAYKRQFQELDVKFTDEVKRADKAEFEAARAQEKLQAAMLERDRVAAERDTLKDLSDELKMIQMQSGATASNIEELRDDSSIGSTTELKSELLQDMKERLLRLEHENKLLKASRITCQDEKMELLQSQFDDACRRKQELETDLRLANQKIFELDSKCSDMRDDSDKPDHSRLHELHQQAELQSLEAQKANQRLYDTEKMLAERDQKLKTLEAALQTKENELKSQEAKYKSYLDKARTVIVALESSGSNVGSGYSRQEFDALKRELQEKEKLIQRMQEEQERMRIMKEQEERLITTAFHGMSMQLHRNASETRLATTAGHVPLSFLSRQRQITSKKPSQTGSSAGQQQHNFNFRFFFIARIITAFVLLFVSFLLSNNYFTIASAFCGLFNLKDFSSPLFDVSYVNGLPPV